MKISFCLWCSCAVSSLITLSCFARIRNSFCLSRPNSSISWSTRHSFCFRRAWSLLLAAQPFAGRSVEEASTILSTYTRSRTSFLHVRDAHFVEQSLRHVSVTIRGSY